MAPLPFCPLSCYMSEMENDPDKHNPPHTPSGFAEPDGQQEFAGHQVRYVDLETLEAVQKKVFAHYAETFRRLAE